MHRGESARPTFPTAWRSGAWREVGGTGARPIDGALVSRSMARKTLTEKRTLYTGVRKGVQSGWKTHAPIWLDARETRARAKTR